MSTINVNVSDATELNLPIGRQLENDVTAVAFDYSDWVTTYGAGTLSLSVQRKADPMPYAVGMTVSGNIATWEISDTDTSKKGTGKAQLTYTVGDQVKKSVIYKFTVYESLGADGDDPGPSYPWYTEIEQAIANIIEDIGDLDDLDTTTKSNLVAAINEVLSSGGGGGGGITVDSALSSTSTNPVQNKVIKAALDNKVSAVSGKALSSVSNIYYTNTSASKRIRTVWVNGDSEYMDIPVDADDVGAIPAPSSPSTGAFLVWNGSAWVAQTLSTWTGGNY